MTTTLTSASALPSPAAGIRLAAAEHLALAAAMRPDLAHYTEALRGVRATLAARAQAGSGAPPRRPRTAMSLADQARHDC